MRLLGHRHDGAATDEPDHGHRATSRLYPYGLAPKAARTHRGPRSRHIRDEAARTWARDSWPSVHQAARLFSTRTVWATATSGASAVSAIFATTFVSSWSSLPGLAQVSTFGADM